MCDDISSIHGWNTLSRRMVVTVFPVLCSHNWVKIWFIKVQLWFILKCELNNSTWHGYKLNVGLAVCQYQIDSCKCQTFPPLAKSPSHMHPLWPASWPCMALLWNNTTSPSNWSSPDVNPGGEHQCLLCSFASNPIITSSKKQCLPPCRWAEAIVGVAFDSLNN